MREQPGVANPAKAASGQRGQLRIGHQAEDRAVRTKFLIVRIPTIVNAILMLEIFPENPKYDEFTNRNTWAVGWVGFDRHGEFGGGRIRILKNANSRTALCGRAGNWAVVRILSGRAYQNVGHNCPPGKRKPRGIRDWGLGISQWFDHGNTVNRRNCLSRLTLLR